VPIDLYAQDTDAGLQSSLSGLHVTAPSPLPFLQGVVVRSFLIERSNGNILIYNAPGIFAAAPAFATLGQPNRLLLNHWHEAMFDAPSPNIPIFVHEKDAPHTSLPIAGHFSARSRIDGDLEIIPAPGHTAGTTMFLWTHGEHRLLFPGDTIWVQGGEWKAVLLAERNRAAYLTTLSLLMTLDFDYLVPWGSEAGQPYAYGVTRAQARMNLQTIFDRLNAGESA
jgi:hypothetical protein